MENTLVIHAGSTKKSLANQDGKSHQLSEQVAVLLSSIETETSFCEKSQAMMILLLLLESITAMTTSGDVLWLSQHRTLKRCEQLGLDDDVVEKVLEKYYQLSKELRKSNPLSF